MQTNDNQPEALKSTSPVQLIVHADDYGITPEQSRLILSYSDACGGNGALNSLSVIVGSPHFAECADILEPYLDSIYVGLHLNIVEGHCSADPALIPLLVDESGMFNRGFGGILLLSITKHGQLREQVSREAAAQLDVLTSRFPVLKGRLRVDSHQHFHMIPAVFDGLLDAVRDGGYTLEYLRIPFEPTRPFLGVNAFKRVAPINWVKHAVLNTLWRANKRKLPDWEKLAGVFCGINFSGHMTAENVAVVRGALHGIAEQSGRALELLFHPGGIKDVRDCPNPALEGFVAFYRSEFRDREGQAVRTLPAD